MNRHSEQVIVTGASSEIGTAILHRLGDESKRTVIATSYKQAINVSHANWHVLPNIDLTKEECLMQLCEKTRDIFDGPFSIIHSVGKFWEHKPIQETKFSEARNMIMSHYYTLFGVAKYLLPLAASQGGGRLLAFSCNSVLYNYPEMAAFTSSKAAIECLVKCIANEWSKDGIVANSLALPTIRTKKVLKLKRNGDHENFITPNELAQIVLDVLGKMSPYMNGNVIKLVKYSDSFYHEAYFDRNPPYSATLIKSLHD